MLFMTMYCSQDEIYCAEGSLYYTWNICHLNYPFAYVAVKNYDASQINLFTEIKRKWRWINFPTWLVFSSLSTLCVAHSFIMASSVHHIEKFWKFTYDSTVCEIFVSVPVSILCRLIYLYMVNIFCIWERFRHFSARIYYYHCGFLAQWIFA